MKNKQKGSAFDSHSVRPSFAEAREGRLLGVERSRLPNPQKLGVNDELLKSFSSTNLIESAYSRAEVSWERVKRWRYGNTTLHCGTSILLFIEKQFRKVKGHKYKTQL